MPRRSTPNASAANPTPSTPSADWFPAENPQNPATVSAVNPSPSPDPGPDYGKKDRDLRAGLAQIRSRIIGHGQADPADLLANPLNFRRHPEAQRQALRGSIAELGWIRGVLVNQRTGHIVDGHARVAEAIRAGTMVPVDWLDLSPEEERLALAVLDPISAMAAQDGQALQALLQEVSTQDDGLRALLSALNDSASLAMGGAGGSSAAADRAAARLTLAQRFIIPPFTVLDARQGYWQERKQAWLAIGARTDLGIAAREAAAAAAAQDDLNAEGSTANGQDAEQNQFDPGPGHADPPPADPGRYDVTENPVTTSQFYPHGAETDVTTSQIRDNVTPRPGAAGSHQGQGLALEPAGGKDHTVHAGPGMRERADPRRRHVPLAQGRETAPECSGFLEGTAGGDSRAVPGGDRCG